MKKTNNLEFDGFKIMSEQEQMNISAGFGWAGALLKGIASFTIGSGFGSIVNLIGDSFYIANKFNATNKALNSQKGEIEFGKDGQLKAKWDNVSISSNSIVIF